MVPGKRSCNICHASYPHRKGFDSPAEHGSAYFKNSSDCATCHGEKFEGKGNAPGCVDCHTFPHPKQWGAGAKHGVAFEAEMKPNTPDWKEPLSSCRNCHYKTAGLKERHPERFIACDSCHHFHLEDSHRDEVPSGMNSHVYFSRQPASTCTSCHKGFVALMPRRKDGCKNCHVGQKFSILFRDADKELAP